MSPAFRTNIVSVVNKTAPRGDDGQEARYFYLVGVLAVYAPDALPEFKAQYADAIGTVEQDRVLGTFGQFVLDYTE